MRFLLEHPAPRGLDDLVACAEAARAAGLDGVLVAEWRALPGALVSAAMVAARVDEVLVAAEVAIGDRHPVEIAEEAAVTDLALGGRLVLVARPSAEVPERYGEALDLIRHAFAARPFRFEGEHWHVPANLPQNVDLPEEQVRVTPAPAQPRLEVWGADRGLPLRSSGRWATSRTRPTSRPRSPPRGGPRRRARPRSARRAGGASRGAAPTCSCGRLREGREAFGQDWACVVAPPSRRLDELGSLVRPRVQLHALTPGLEEFWDAERPWERGA